MDPHPLRLRLARALAFAHAALDRPSAAQLREARREAHAVLDSLRHVRPVVTLEQGHDLWSLLAQLHQLVGLLERAVPAEEIEAHARGA